MIHNFINFMTGEQLKALEGRLWKAEMLFNDFKERFANYAA